MIESYWIILINCLITLFVCGWIFKYFDLVFKSQVEITDKIINHLSTFKKDKDYLYGIDYELDNSHTLTSHNKYFEEE